MKYSDQYILDIPKTDLHVHLDGSLRYNSLIEMAKDLKVDLPAYTEEGLRKEVFKDRYKDLGEYLTGFMYTCNVLRSRENLERTAYELAIDNQKEGVRYIEVRFAPQLLIDNKELTMESVLEAVNNGLKKAELEFNSKKAIKNGEEPPFRYGIIACAMRMFGPKNFSPYYTDFFKLHQFSDEISVIQMGALELAKGVVKVRDELGLPIVGFDLAGQEAGYPAEYFKDAYNYIHHHFMHKTVHAGEAYGAESIFQAITYLHADRIGHCYYLFDTERITSPEITDKDLYIQRLSSYIAERRITVEVCLTSNFQTNPDLVDLKKHTLQKMLDHRISVTFCTDNRLVSNTTVTKEIELAVKNFKIGPRMLKNLVVYGFKRSFFPESYYDKRRYISSVIDYFEKMNKKHKIIEDDENF